MNDEASSDEEMANNTVVGSMSLIQDLLLILHQEENSKQGKPSPYRFVSYAIMMINQISTCLL
jgi:hypothetical protein